MRITLDLEDDVYLQLKHLALITDRSFDEVASELLRKAFAASREKTSNVQDNFPELPVFIPKEGAETITNEFINRLRKEGI